MPGTDPRLAPIRERERHADSAEAEHDAAAEGADDRAVARLPTGPGLGIEVNEEKVRAPGGR